MGKGERIKEEKFYSERLMPCVGISVPGAPFYSLPTTVTLKHI